MSNINYFWSELRMSLGKQKNLIILGAVATALLVAGVLVADYTDVLPGRANADEQAKTCAAGEAKACCPGQAKMAGFPQVMAATEAAPAEPCCGAEKPAGACCNPGADCDTCEKPAGCCEEAPKGCCEEAKPAEAPAGCCATKAAAATE